MALQLSIGISESEITAFSKKFNLNLLNDYIEFLLKYNGLFLSDETYCTIPFPKVDDGEIDFQILYGINTLNENFDLEIQNDICDELENLKNPLIIASDSGNNYYVMDCNKEDNSIYYWDRCHIHFDENYDYKEVDEEGNLYKLTSNFKDFYKLVLDNVAGNTEKEIISL